MEEGVYHLYISAHRSLLPSNLKLCPHLMIAVFGDEFPHSQVGQLSDQVVALSIVHGEHPGLGPVLVSRSLLEEVSCLPCRDLDCLLEQTIFLLDVSDISPSHYNLGSRDS